jgi:hypothetical protein
LAFDIGGNLHATTLASSGALDYNDGTLIIGPTSTLSATIWKFPGGLLTGKNASDGRRHAQFQGLMSVRT